MSTSFEPPRSTGGTGRSESIRDAIPDAEPIHGAHETYAKGEVGSIGALIGDISSDFSTLMRQEVALAKAEATQAGMRIGKAVAMFAAAGIAALLVLLFVAGGIRWRRNSGDLVAGGEKGAREGARHGRKDDGAAGFEGGRRPAASDPEQRG